MLHVSMPVGEIPATAVTKARILADLDMRDMEISIAVALHQRAG